MALLKEQLKRFWAIGVVLLIIYVLVGIVPLYVVGTIENDPRAPYNLAQNMIDMLSMNHPVPIITMLLGPIMAMLALFPYHSSDRAAAAFYSFPISKQQLFFTNIAAAMILMLLPLTVFTIALLFPVYYTGDFVAFDRLGRVSWSQAMRHPNILLAGLWEGQLINTFPRVMGLFGRISLGSLFYLSLFVLAITISGNKVVAVLLSGALPFIPAALHLLGRSISNLYLFGFSNHNVEDRIVNTLAFSNPAMFGQLFGAGGGNRWLRLPLISTNLTVWPESITPYIISYTLIALALLVIAYICSHTRRLERTGDSVVFTAMKNVCVFVVAMAGMLFMGFIFFGMTRNEISMYIGLVLGFVIAYIIGQMIAEKSLDVRHKIKHLFLYGAVMVGLYVAMLLVTGFGMGFYTNRVPLASEVSGVSLSHGMRLNRMFMMSGESFIEDANIIAKVTEMHRSIVDNSNRFRRLQRGALTGIEWRYYEQVPITYRLQDGSQMMRMYVLPRDFVRNIGLDEIRMSRASLLAQVRGLEYLDYVNSVELRFNFATESGERDFLNEILVRVHEQDEIMLLIEAVVEDYISSSQENHARWLREIDHGISYNHHWQHTVDLWGNVEMIDYELDWQNRRIWRNFNLHAHGYAPNTLRWLEERGLID